MEQREPWPGSKRQLQKVTGWSLPSPKIDVPKRSAYCAAGMASSKRPCTTCRAASSLHKAMSASLVP
eukprot:2169046-Pleurochrysis_carterae.AAC.2